MRTIIISFLVFFAVALVSCDDSKGKKFPFGSSSSDTGSSEGTAGVNQPPDQVNDQKDSKEFKFQTIHDVSFDLQL